MQSSVHELNLHRYLEGLQVLHAETFDDAARFCFIMCPAQLHVGTDDFTGHRMALPINHRIFDEVAL